MSEFEIAKSKSLESSVRQLEETGQYRVLQLVPTPVAKFRDLKEGERLAVIIDTETTGLDITKDEIVEIGVLAFIYSIEGDVEEVVELWGELREPSVPLSKKSAMITGLKDEDLKGKRVDLDRLNKIVESAAIIIAHNAAFDRPLCEKLLDTFRFKPWACSATEIDWESRGFEGAKLSYLLYQQKLFHHGHRALDDCIALFALLRSRQPGFVNSFKELLASARSTRYRVQVRAQFDSKDDLKRRGYRWSAGGSAPRTWWIEVREEALPDELAFLQQIGIKEGAIKTTQETALERFKLRR